MRPVPTWFRGLAYVMAVLFAGSAALQLDDPDPLRWIAMYGGACLVAVALPATRRVAVVAVGLGLGAAIWALVLLSEVWGVIEVSDLVSKMSAKGGAVEVGREVGGLGIVALFLLLGGGYRGQRA